MESYFHTRASEREAVAAQSKESGVAIARGFNTCEELMPGMMAPMFVADLVMLVLRHRHAGPRGFADIQRCTVAAEDVHG